MIINYLINSINYLINSINYLINSINYLMTINFNHYIFNKILL